MDVRAPKGEAGLVLTGGGARAAYQVGVLEGIAQIRREVGAQGMGNPLPIVTGTSAGAINAAALACGADDFDAAVQRISQVWRELSAGEIYRTDPIAMLDAAARWRMVVGMGQFIAKWLRIRPRSLLDNAPLADLLAQRIPLGRLPWLLRNGHLKGLAVTASSYSSGEHATFYQCARHVEPWVRSQRVAVPTRITTAHLIASSAIPFVFPATELPMAGHVEYFGDGSMRQSAPLAPAIHLGAQRILAIGAGRMAEPRGTGELAPNALTGYPSVAQIAGHAMSSIFLDSLATDVERLRRINHTLSLVPSDALQESGLRPLELLLISPSQRIDAIAARHVPSLPGAVRRMFVGLGADSTANVKAAAFASYLLFETPFTEELIALGRADTLAQREAVCAFFDWTGQSEAGGEENRLTMRTASSTPS